MPPRSMTPAAMIDEHPAHRYRPRVAARRPRNSPVELIGAVQRLRLESATAEVVRAFDARGADCILLKGVSLARWLYPDGPPRSFTDCDLLVPPGARSTAQDVLTELGFEPQLDELTMPSWWAEHATAWQRSQDGTVVDLHRTLPGVGADPQRVWDTLAANVDSIVVGGARVQTLTIPGRAFHLALHGAQHGGAWGTSLEELGRALSLADEAVWRAGAEIAADLDGTAAFCAGLRLVPEGRELAARLGLSTESTTDVELWATGSPPVAAGFHQLAGAPDLQTRLAILGRKLVPPPTFMRAWSEQARRGRTGLMLAYVWRPVWLVLRAPAGFRAWRHARRRASR